MQGARLQVTTRLNSKDIRGHSLKQEVKKLKRVTFCGQQKLCCIIALGSARSHLDTNGH